MDWRAICCSAASVKRNRRRRGLYGAYWRDFGWHGAIPFFKYRHIALFDRDIGLQEWSNRPLNFQEVKAEARARYRRATPASPDPARGGVYRQKALCLYRAAKSQNLVMITKPDHGDRSRAVPSKLKNRRPITSTIWASAPNNPNLSFDIFGCNSAAAWSEPLTTTAVPN